jgi:hypothetical protein
MEGILLILLILVFIGFSKGCGRRGGYVVKDNPASKKPKVGAAPQPLRNKQGRTKDEQELHEWLEDNPR